MGSICDTVRFEIFFISSIGYRGYLYVTSAFVFSKADQLFKSDFEPIERYLDCWHALSICSYILKGHRQNDFVSSLARIPRSEVRF